MRVAEDCVSLDNAPAGVAAGTEGTIVLALPPDQAEGWGYLVEIEREGERKLVTLREAWLEAAA